jgi:hypothetical protein
MGPTTRVQERGDPRWCRRAVAALQRAASAHERAAVTHEVAYRIHSEAEVLFRAQLRLADSARERRLAATHLGAASTERQRAVSDWAAAQLASQQGWWALQLGGDGAAARVA